jgi:hypothetical protein
VQRKCGAELGAPAPDCQPSDAGVVGWQLLFRVNCDELLPGQAGRIATLAAGSQLRIHGFASLEGDPAFNLDLSCHRANRVAELVRSTRPDLTIEGVFKHGASPQSSPGSVPDANPPDFWRSVIVEEIKAAPRPPQPTTRCGPDATDWFLDQVAVGKRNARVLAVRQQLDTAAFFAPQIAPLGQLDSMEILEGVVAEKVAAAWRAAGMPRHTAEANAQLGQSQMGQLEATAAKSAALGLDTAAITTLTALRDASLQWKELVGTGKPFDFKNDASTMKAPRSAHCPDPQCPNTITLCAGSRGLNCFVKDLPGNVFYAAVGRFVGFSENVLQLGSQFAQLAAGGSWDPPEDTEMIAFGFNLPHPLTRAAFCSALESAKTSFDLRPCGECQEQPDPPPAKIDPQ